MFDRELGGVHSRPRVQLAQSVIVVAFFQEREIGRLWEVALVVEQMKDPHWLLRYQVYHRQIVLCIERKEISHEATCTISVNGAKILNANVYKFEYKYNKYI